LLRLNPEDWNDNKDERDFFLEIAINIRFKIEENADIPEDCKNEILELLSGIKE